MYNSLDGILTSLIGHLYVSKYHIIQVKYRQHTSVTIEGKKTELVLLEMREIILSYLVNYIVKIRQEILYIRSLFAKTLKSCV